MSWLGGRDRHLRNLGYVPPEVHEDPDTLGYTLDLSGAPNVKTLSAAQLRRACDAVLPRHEQTEIIQAATLAHAGDEQHADRHRQAGGYGGY